MRIFALDYSAVSIRCDSRSGATLTEVLMAILVMGIGLVGAISIFPASVLRSAHAHALTSAANLRFNAESAIAMYPQLLANPDRVSNSVRFNQAPDLAFIVDPLGIDVYGAALFDGPQVGGAGTLCRYSAGFLRSLNEESLKTFRTEDKWTTRYEDVPVSGDLSASPNSLTFSSLASQGVYLSDDTPTRLVIFGPNGDRCQVRDIVSSLNPTAPNTALGNTVYWANQLPPGFVGGVAQISKVRVEQREDTFTWLLTARRQPSAINAPVNYSVYVAVFHKRSYSPTERDVFHGTAQNVFNNGSTIATITIPPGVSPALKRGGYVLDAAADGGYWYRIQDYVESGTQATITLDRPAINTSNSAMFMKGVVAVFKINDVTIDRTPRVYERP